MDRPDCVRVIAADSSTLGMVSNLNRRRQMHEVQKTKEHAWLQKLVGEWAGEGEASMGPDQPPMKWSVDESVRAIGDVWVLGESKGLMPDGGPTVMLITLGFDPAKKRFIGTFIGSSMTNLWVYDGELDVTGKILTLNAEGPSMAGDGKMANYQDIVEIVSDDHRILSSQMQMPDGTWSKFMSAHYRRKK